MDSVNDQVLMQFCEVTGASLEQATLYLQIHEGKIEEAITFYMESDGAILPNNTKIDDLNEKAIAQAVQEDMSSHESIQSVPNTESVRAPIERRTDMLMGGDISSNQSHWVDTPLPAISHSSSSHHHAIWNQSSSNSELNTDQDNKLAQIFRPPFELMFHGNVSQAKEEAKKAQKWILIDLQDTSNFQCQMLNRDLWKNQLVRECIEQHFIFLQLNQLGRTGQEYINMYPVQTMPHIAIIDPLVGERLKVWSHVLDPSTFLDQAQEFLELRSLDPKSAGKKKQDEKVISENEMSNHPNTTETTTHVSDSIQAVDRPEPSKDDTTNTTLRFVMPDGKRVVRRFSTQHLIQHLFEFVKFACVPNLPFDLLYHRSSLASDLERTLEQLNLKMAVIHIVILT